MTVRQRSVIGTMAGVCLALAVSGCGGETTAPEDEGSATTAAGETCPDDDFPSETIEYIIAFDAGGESDRTARLQQGPLEERLGVDITISYLPGAGGALAWSQITDLSADGHAIMGYNMPHIVLQPLVREEEAGYKTEDLKQVYMFQLTPYIFATTPGSSFQTFEDLVTAAKDSPGAITIGGVGEFTGPHLVFLQLQAQLPDVEFTYVPFSGTGDLVPAVLGGHVDTAITNTPAVVANPDQLTGLAVASEETFEALPDVPTLQELDIDIVEGAYRGVAVPPDTPECRVDVLAEAIGAVNTDPEFAQTMEDQGFILVNFGPEEATDFIDERRESYDSLLTELGLIQ